jgi:hypothetical protein
LPDLEHLREVTREGEPEVRLWEVSLCQSEDLDDCRCRQVEAGGRLEHMRRPEPPTW